jgi:hypothetical protein
MPSHRSDHVVGVQNQCGAPERCFGEQAVLGSEHPVSLLLSQEPGPAYPSDAQNDMMSYLLDDGHENSGAGHRHFERLLAMFQEGACVIDQNLDLFDKPRALLSFVI